MSGEKRMDGRQSAIVEYSAAYSTRAERRLMQGTGKSE